MGAYGDGGAVVTNKKYIYEKILKLRTHGAKKFKHNLVGVNSRLHSMQAVVLNHKLTRINLINNKKRNIAKFYYQNLKNKKIKLFKIPENSCFHQFVILVKGRKKFLSYLKKNKIPMVFITLIRYTKLKLLRVIVLTKISQILLL